MSFKKLSMVLFISGVLISLFSGAFDVLEGLDDIKLVVLLILGLLVGLLNISSHEQNTFLLASLTFLFSANLMLNLTPNRLFLLSNFLVMIENLMIFIAPAAFVIALKIVFEYASESDKNIVMELPNPHERHFLENLWDFVVFVSVALVLVILILQSFFDLSPYPMLLSSIFVLDIIILIIFVIDLFVLFKKSKSISAFLYHNWVDILAVLPLGSAFRMLKLVRLVRIIKVFAKAEKVMKLNRASKFFSDDSGFNRLIHEDKKLKRKNPKKSSSKSKK